MNLSGAKPTSSWACVGRRRIRGRLRDFVGMVLGRASPLLVLAALLSPTGCSRSSPELVTVLTDWSEADCAALDATIPIPISWVRTTEGADPTQLVGRVRLADLVLGGPASSYRRLESEGRLLSSDSGPAWIVVRRKPIGMAIRGSATDPVKPEDLDNLARSERIALGDPRRDSITMAWARAVLAGPSWAEGYARLIRIAGRATPISFGAGSASAQLEQGAADAAPATPAQAERPGLEFLQDPAGSTRLECAAIVRGTTRPDLARQFLRSIADRAGTGPELAAEESAAGELLADLLGSTLVDAQIELRAAWSDLIAAGRPARPEMWMTMAPPWPPASIGLMIEETSRGDPEADVRLDTLAEQVAPSAMARAWLRESWAAPARPIDGQLLNDLARAADGQLVSEPRFRAWLRAEWTAWARQRYRRAARLATS